MSCKQVLSVITPTYSVYIDSRSLWRSEVSLSRGWWLRRGCLSSQGTLTRAITSHNVYTHGGYGSSKGSLLLLVSVGYRKLLLMCS